VARIDADKAGSSMRGRESIEYRRLIEALMNLGWYRIGESYEPAEPLQRCWDFRSGHTLEERSSRRRCVTASDEAEAMRSLLQELAEPVNAGHGSPSPADHSHSS
jgi:hypothetical protein